MKNCHKPIRKNLIHIIIYSVLIILNSSCSVILSPIIGDVADDTMKAKQNLSKDASLLIDQAFKGINSCLADVHVHAIGNGSGNSGNWLNPKMNSIFHPYKKIQYNVYLNAAGVKNADQADQEYIKRLIQLLKAEPRYGKVFLFAFDYSYKNDGTKDLSHSSFYVSNQYVYNLSKKYPQFFIPVISVHPSRKDAVSKLTKWAKKGVRFIKWLPNGQGIDPSRKEYINYYKEVIKQKMAIISHTGDEKAVDGEEFQKFGNPNRFILPLDMGVKIIMSHVASLGNCKVKNSNKEEFCFKTFMHLFQNPKYKNNLFAEISALTIYTHVGEAIDVLLENPKLSKNLMNGSDYPLPAINFIFRTSQLRKLKYITESEEKLLNEIYHYNPLIFDFVLKRTLKHPKTGQKFSNKTFMLPNSICKMVNL